MVVKHRRYEVGPWREECEDYWWAFLYLAGDRQIAEQCCRKACFPQGLCVTIESVKYIFAGGSEDGVRIGFIQYPPFPEPIENIKSKAISIGKEIAEQAYQWSFTIVDPSGNTYYSRRTK